MTAPADLRKAEIDDAWIASVIHDGILSHRPYWDRVDFNRSHVFKLELTDVNLETPNEHIKYQSNRVSKAADDLKGRMCENDAVVECRALSGRSTDNTIAENVAQLWNRWLMQRKEKTGESIQEGLSDGQIVDGRGILHAWRADQIHPSIPDYEFEDELPEGDQKSGDYRKVESEDEAANEEAKGKKWMTSEAGIRKRTEINRAKAGCPYQWAVLDSRDVIIVPDMVGIATGIWIRSVKLVQYNHELKDNGVGIDMTQDPSHRIYQRVEASPGDPTSNQVNPDRTKRLTVATVWDRSCWYEVFCENDQTLITENSAWTYVKGDKHGFGEPPFWVAGALTFNHADVQRKYRAYLHGACDEKTRADFMTALMFALTEATAVKMHFLKRKPGTPAVLDDGGSIDLAADVNAARFLPDGVDISQLQNDVSQGFMVAQEKEEKNLGDALPPTPGEIGTGTAPWTARIITQNAGIIPKNGITRQALCIQQMIRAIMRDAQTDPAEGGYGEPLVGFSRGKDGKDPVQTITIETSVMPSLEISVSINPISSAEQITMTEHGAGLYERKMITREDLYTRYIPVENSKKYMHQLDAEEIFNVHIRPGLLAQKTGEKYGAKYVMGPDGKFLGLGGSVVSPQEILAKNGATFKPQQGPIQSPQNPRFPMKSNVPGVPGGMGLTTGPLRDQPPPGVIPQPSLAG